MNHDQVNGDRHKIGGKLHEEQNFMERQTECGDAKEGPRGCSPDWDQMGVYY